MVMEYHMSDVIESGLSKKDFTIVDKQVLYKGFFSLNKYRLKYKSFAGAEIGPIDREIFERGQAAAIVPYDPVNKKVVLIEQFRPGAIYDEETPWHIEIVAGMIDGSENPANTVCREAEEEAGIKCERIRYATKFYTSSGGCTETITMYVGKVDANTAEGFHGLACECEDIRVFSVSLDEAMSLVEQGKIRNSVAIIGIQYLALHVSEIDKEWL